MLYPQDDMVEAVEVTAADLARLDPEEFLNDTVIDFFIKCGLGPSAVLLRNTAQIIWADVTALHGAVSPRDSSNPA